MLFVNFDENDGFFDHVPPPAAPTYLTYDPDPAAPCWRARRRCRRCGEYHELLVPDANEAARALLHKPYGLGAAGADVRRLAVEPRRLGQLPGFDHTSVIRFLEKRFGVREPNISAWRRAVCGDLTSAFDFANPHNTHYAENLPDTVELAERARALPTTTTPPTPDLPRLPVQDRGARPSRALPYELQVNAAVKAGAVVLTFVNSGEAGACFHVYDASTWTPRLAATRSRRTSGWKGPGTSAPTATPTTSGCWARTASTAISPAGRAPADRSSGWPTNRARERCW